MSILLLQIVQALMECRKMRHFICFFIVCKSRVKSGNFGHQVFANSGNPDETAPYEPSHQDFHCLFG